MIKIEFTEADIKTLNYERYNHPHPRVMQKMETLFLKSKGIPHKKIAELADITPNTLTSYLKVYKKGGINKLKELNFRRPASELQQYTSRIEDYFRKNPPGSIKEAMAKIEKLTGINRKETQVRKFLKSIGMKLRKVGTIPAKADIEKQETFKKKKLDPRLEEAKSGKRAVFFVDAAHFVLAPFLGFLWSFTRLFVKAPSGRKRFNVLGALDAITHKLITVTNDSYINAQSVCELLRKLHKLNLGIPITLVLDNAKYQKCKIVEELAKFLNIELLYLPPYSPNLNLIERLWKFVKKKCLNSKYYPEFNCFKEAISECLNQTHDVHKEELDSLLTLNFQTFKKTHFIAA